MRARSLGIIALGLLIAAVPIPSLSASAEAQDEEYAVYAALLSARWSGEDKSPFVIQAETSDAGHFHSDNFDQTAEFLRKEFKEREPSIALTDELESFRRVRNSAVRLDPGKLGLPNAKVVPSAEIDPIFESPGLENSWAKFREHFGGAWGIVRLSRVGFNADRSRAILSVSGSCGPLCGSGDYVVLEKKSGKWRVLGRVMAWIS